MSWVLLTLLAAVLVMALVARSGELLHMSHRRRERASAREQGSHNARLQFPHIDLTRCLGCGTCVAACPEEGVLELLHGQAVVVHGARCVGHGRCAAECPVGAIALTLADVAERRDLPALDEHFESLTSPGLFLAGEVTGYALVRTAIGHGTSVAASVAARLESGRAGAPDRPGVHDLVIVGAGPAGLACSLEARRRGLEFVTLEQADLGGTVSSYPRRKLVLTQPVHLPLVGPLDRTTYTKEELLETWRGAVRDHDLPLRTGEQFLGLERAPDGLFRVRATSGEYVARNVCLALGRRGTPNRLGVPGEELDKVSYGLLDAHSYQDRRLLVVGGGDSAVEAALGLAEQPGNQVLLSYRKAAFFRLKARNQRRLEAALEAGELELLFNSRVLVIREDSVDIAVEDATGPHTLTLANDEVFIFAGGKPPFELLEQAGVSFDPALRPAAAELAEQGSGLTAALAAALACVLVGLGWTLWQRDYYALERAQRAASPLHELLRPAGPLGLALGLLAVLAIAANLAYLLRRSPRVRFERFSLRRWMTMHVATGVLALLLALVHSAMLPAQTVGGHALAGLVVLVATGALGRYLYACVPRAANGRELEHDELQARLAALSAEWDQSASGFTERVAREVGELAAHSAWRKSLPARLLGLLTAKRELRALLRRFEREGRAEGVGPSQLTEAFDLAVRAHAAALAAAHFEDLRGLLASWRWLHRWAALLMVLLVARHVVVALRYGDVLGGLFGGGG